MGTTRISPKQRQRYIIQKLNKILRSSAMRLVTMAFLFCLASSIADAAPFSSEKTIICDDQTTILDSLVNKFNETVQWMGKDLQDGTAYILTVNSKEGTWTYLQSNGKIACVLGVGNKSTLFLGEKT